MTTEQRLTFGALINLVIGYGLGYVYCGKRKSDAKAFYLSLGFGLPLGLSGWGFLINALVCDELFCGIVPGMSGLMALAFQYLFVNLPGAIHLRGMYE